MSYKRKSSIILFVVAVLWAIAMFLMAKGVGAHEPQRGTPVTKTPTGTPPPTRITPTVVTATVIPTMTPTRITPTPVTATEIVRTVTPTPIPPTQTPTSEPEPEVYVFYGPFVSIGHPYVPPTPTPTPIPPTPTPEPETYQSCSRINLEVWGGVTPDWGTYRLHEVPSGRQLLEWHAAPGEQDSGWMHFAISNGSVWARATFTYDSTGETVGLLFENHVPNNEAYLALWDGGCHAAEVRFP